MKNLLTQWETKEKNQKTDGGVMLIDGELAELKDDVKYKSLPKV